MLDAPSPRCVICPRQLLDHETGRFICLPCEHRIDQDLRKLAGPAGLYARLCLRIQPGRGGSDGPVVTRSSGHPMPCNEAVLTLTANGGLVSTLETWVEDWVSYGLARRGGGGRLQHRVDTAIATLRLNLTRAASRHPALKDFNQEIGSAVRAAERLITGERAPRRVPLVCGCGYVLRVTLDTDGCSCPGCSTEYRHAELMSLPIAERSAAA